MTTSMTTNVSTNNLSRPLPVTPPQFITLSTPTTFNLACILAVGIVGFLANSLLILALCSSKRDRKSAPTMQIVNQSALELSASIMIIARFSIKLRSYYMTDWWGYQLCKIVDSGLLQVIFVYGSTGGIVAITLERYCKIIYPVVHRNLNQKWLIRAAIVTPWLYGFALAIPAVYIPAVVIRGACVTPIIGSTLGQQQGFSMFLFVAIYLAPIGTMILCYARILLVIKSSTKIGQQRQGLAQASGAGGDAAIKPRFSSKEMNIVATMITQAVCFVITNSPTSIFFTVITMAGLNPAQYTNVRYVVQFIGFLNVCSNPLAYALKYRRVHASARRALAALRQKPQPSVSHTASGTQSTAMTAY